MKKIITVVIVGFLAIGVGLSQSLTLTIEGVDISNDTLFLIGTTEDALLESHVSVNNITDKEIEVKAKKTEVFIIDNTVNSFCWGSCFPPFIFEATQAIKIPAEGTDSDSFIGDYTPEGNEGTSVLRYTFFAAANVTDSVSLIVYYQVGAAGIRDWTLDHELLRAYPNPTSGLLNLDFPGDTNQLITLRMFSITGQILKEKVMQYGQSSARLDLSEYPKGIMFLEIVNDDGQSAIKKIILTR